MDVQACGCSLLGVCSNGKKLRLILDLRYVCKRLVQCKLNMEDLKTVARVFEKGDSHSGTKFQGLDGKRYNHYEVTIVIRVRGHGITGCDLGRV